MTRLLILCALAFVVGISTTLPEPFNYIGVGLSVGALLVAVGVVTASGSVRIRGRDDR